MRVHPRTRVKPQYTTFSVWRTARPSLRIICRRSFMKKFFAITALIIFISTLAFAQSAPPPNSDTTVTHYSDEQRHNWAGLDCWDLLAWRALLAAGANPPRDLSPEASKLILYEFQQWR